jgi:hypothetical protein
MQKITKLKNHVIDNYTFKLNTKQWNKFAAWFNKNPNTKTFYFFITGKGFFVTTKNVSQLEKIVS